MATGQQAEKQIVLFVVAAVEVIAPMGIHHILTLLRHVSSEEVAEFQVADDQGERWEQAGLRRVLWFGTRLMKYRPSRLFAKI